MTDDGRGVIPKTTRVGSSAANIASRVAIRMLGAGLVLALAGCDGSTNNGTDAGSAAHSGEGVLGDASRGTEQQGNAAPSTNSDGTIVDGNSVDDESTPPQAPGTGDNTSPDTVDERTASSSDTESSHDPTTSDSNLDDSNLDDSNLDDSNLGDPGTTDDGGDLADAAATDPNESEIGSSDAQEPANEVPSVEATGLFTWLEDSDRYDFGSLPIGDPAPDRSLVFITQSASNDVVVYESLLVDGVEATKVASVGEDVEPSAPTAIFVLPFPEGTTANVQMVLSTLVVRSAVAVFALYGLESLTPHDVASITSMAPSTLTLDVSKPGIAVAGLAMAGTAMSTATILGIEPEYGEVMVEGTPTLVAGGFAAVEPGTLELAISVTNTAYNFRAVAAVFQ